uniref:DUF4806 domain-containing protein n=1 Tax=Anopheles maculatus TaxID=74869 RepID=A0A182SDH5_9DIPT
MESNAMQFAMERMETNVVSKIPAFDRTEKFKLDILRDVEELEKFEERLNDDEYLKKVCGWIDVSLGLVRESEHRMHIILDQIFDRKLFATYSWTGAGKDKRALNVLKNVLGLFEHAGTTPMQRVDSLTVERFMRKKLHNSGTRALAKGVRKSLPHSRKHRRTLQAALATKYAISNAKQSIPSTTRVRVLPRNKEQRGQSSSSASSSSSSSSSSSYKAQVDDAAAAADNLSGTECIVIKEDPAAYIDVMDEYEDMLDYK